MLAVAVHRAWCTDRQVSMVDPAADKDGATLPSYGQATQDAYPTQQGYPPPHQGYVSTRDESMRDCTIAPFVVSPTTARLSNIICTNTPAQPTQPQPQPQPQIIVKSQPKS